MKNKLGKFFIERPWLDEKGNILPDDTIKKICSDWPSSTWDRFLKETVDRSCVEYLPRNQEAFYRRLEFIQISTLFEESVWEDFEYLRPFLQEVVGKLSSRQYQIVKGIFYEEKTEREIAEELGITRGTVCSTKREVLKKMEKEIRNKIFKRNVKSSKDGFIIF